MREGDEERKEREEYRLSVVDAKASQREKTREQQGGRVERGSNLETSVLLLYD